MNSVTTVEHWLVASSEVTSLKQRARDTGSDIIGENHEREIEEEKEQDGGRQKWSCFGDLER